MVRRSRSCAAAAVLVSVLIFQTAADAARPIEQASERAEELWREAVRLKLKGDSSDALEHLRRIVRAFPATPAAPKAQLEIGDLFAANGEYQNAFAAYQEVITRFPASPLFTPAIEGQFALVQRIFAEDRRHAQARNPRPRELPSRGEATEMLRQILRNGRYAPFSAEALYQLAVTLDRLGQSREAISEFWRFLGDYADDLLADDAAFQIGFIEYRIAREPNRERSSRLRARYAFEFFLHSFPESEKVAEARHILAQLSEWDGESLRRSGRLYEKAGQREAALKSYLEALPLSSGEEETARLKERIERLQQAPP